MKDTKQLVDLVWLWFRSPHDELAAMMMRTPPPWTIETVCRCRPLIVIQLVVFQQQYLN
jgi:hypothetical protein